MRVMGLYAKLERGEPMTRCPSLRVEPGQGITGTATAGQTPRQICVALAVNLRRHGVKPSGSRANLILDGISAAGLNSGSVLTIGKVKLRITFSCEPCAHGAVLADAPMRQFRQIDRSL